MSKDGENYSFYGHNLRARPVNPQQVRQMNRPQRMVVRQGSSDNALQKLETLSILSPAHNTSIETGASDNGAFVHVPHPPSTQRSNSPTTLRAVDSKGHLKRTRLESPRTSGSEDESKYPKHLFNSRSKLPSALPPLEITPNQRRGSTGSIGSVDSVMSAVSSSSTDMDSPRRHRNLRGIEPLKEIKSDIADSFKAYHRDAKGEQMKGSCDTRHSRVCFASPEKDFVDETASVSEQEKKVWRSTPSKSQNPELSFTCQPLQGQTKVDEGDADSDSEESLTCVSSSSDEDSESDCSSASELETTLTADQIVKSLHKKRNPNSTLPTLPVKGENTFESGKYETMNHFQESNVADTTLKSNLSGTYESVTAYQNTKTGFQSKESHHSSTSDLTKFDNSKKGHLHGHYSTDTDLSVKSAGSSQVSHISQASLLPKVSAHSVRSRNKNFLKEEMDKYLPDRQLGVFVATWNMHEEKELPYCLDDLLLPPNVDYLQDIYVVGVQESTSSRKELEIKLQEALGPSHVLMHSCSFGVLHLAIFIRRELVWFCSATTQASVATRIGHQFKTKGALAVTFSVFGTSFLFINSHFTSDEGKALDRVNDYQTICKSLSLPPVGQTEDITNKFDRVFWLGDFNFRIEMEREKVIKTIEKYKEQNEPDYKELLEKDQMTNLMDEDKVFIGFKEAPVKFLPSYKHDLHSDKYDSSSKMRTPSWTDRVVYKSQDQGCIQSVCYNSCATIRTSDHRPVFGIFEVTLNSCEENIPLTGGQYMRDVYIEASRRRAAGPRHQDQSAVCTIL